MWMQERAVTRFRRSALVEPARDNARAVSSENVDLVRESIERFNRHDIPGVLRLMDPEIRFEHRMAELQGSFTGVDAVRGWLADIAEHFDHWRIDCDDFRDLGDRVLALGTLSAVGKSSGVETEVPYTVLARLRNGALTEFTDYGDREKAIEAAGLSA
jgi:ketosteroid isomerase-like protein